MAPTSAADLRRDRQEPLPRWAATLRPEVSHIGRVLAFETLGNDRAMARFRVSLNAEQRAGAAWRKLSHDRAKIHTVEDLPCVPLPVCRRKLHSRTLSDTATSVLCILEPTKLRGRRELPMVAVGDLRISKCPLKPHCVGPRVLASPDPTALTDIQQEPDVAGTKRLQERLEIPLINADRAHALHPAQTATTGGRVLLVEDHAGVRDAIACVTRAGRPRRPSSRRGV